MAAAALTARLSKKANRISYSVGLFGSTTGSRKQTHSPFLINNIGVVAAVGRTSLFGF